MTQYRVTTHSLDGAGLLSSKDHTAETVMFDDNYQGVIVAGEGGVTVALYSLNAFVSAVRLSENAGTIPAAVWARLEAAADASDDQFGDDLREVIDTYGPGEQP